MHNPGLRSFLKSESFNQQFVFQFYLLLSFLTVKKWSRTILSSELKQRLLPGLSARLLSLYHITPLHVCQTDIPKYKCNDMPLLPKTMESLIPPQGIEALLSLTLTNLSSLVLLHPLLHSTFQTLELSFLTGTKPFLIFRLCRYYAPWLEHILPSRQPRLANSYSSCSQQSITFFKKPEPPV